MYKWPYTGWASAGIDAWSLGIEASAVIGLRTVKMAAGGIDAAEEARLMVSEKMLAAFELQAALVTGRLGDDPLTGTSKTHRH